MNWQLILRLGIGSVCLTVAAHAALADDPPQPPASAASAAQETAPTDPTEKATDATANAPPGEAVPGEEPPAGEALPGEAAVRDALRPVAEAIKRAARSRATVELTTRSMIDGRVVASETSNFQIASHTPNLYRVHLKAEQQQLQVVCDGKQASVLLGGQAYYQTPAPETLQHAVTELPVPLGPYPEPLMALTLAGVNVADSLLVDMQNLELVDRDPYDGVPAVQLRGTQADGVTWVLWLATDETPPRPLRMKVDLTAVVVGDGEAGLPPNFAFELDFKFTQWRMDGELDKAIFTFKPPADAQQFESLQAYAQSIAEETTVHPLVGKPAPDFTANLLDGTQWQLSKQQGKVVVLDFWATWCGPCVEAMPVIAEVAEAFADRDVVLYSVNIGESAEEIKEFLQRLKIDVPVLLDPEAKLADTYAAEAIPQTVLIGKDGRIEAVHIGYSGLDALKQELTEQLKTLADGGQLAAAEDE